MSIPGETPQGFIQDAREFLVTAQVALNRASNVSIPAYFLLGRSVELSLKAFLLHQGMTPKELRSRKLGHDLVALMNAARIRGIAQHVRLTPHEEGVLELLSYDYLEKRFEYRVSGGTYLLPLIDVTEMAARKLVDNLEPIFSRQNS